MGNISPNITKKVVCFNSARKSMEAWFNTTSGLLSCVKDKKLESYKGNCCSKQKVPAILWVRSSFTSCRIVTCSSFSGFNWSVAGLDDRLLVFKRLAIRAVVAINKGEEIGIFGQPLSSGNSSK